MKKIVINGMKRLGGEIEISGMKNSALPIVYSTLLINGKCTVDNIPFVNDVMLSLQILKHLGAKVDIINSSCVEIDTTDISLCEPPMELVRQMRASYYLMGAQLGRFGTAHVCYPGGDDFGMRPIDQHIKGFESLGAKVNVSGGYIDIEAPNGLSGANVFFDVVSVGATVNVILAAVKTEGVTIIESAAREPHIVDLANFLNTCGAQISGAGTDTIKITGVKELHGSNYTIVPDMIEAGTYMVAAAVAGGRVKINNIIPKHLESISAKLLEMNVTVEEMDDYVIVSREGELSSCNIKTLPYPGFPTDMQPQFAAALCYANGVSHISEGVWDNRFRYIDELRCMGANIDVSGRNATIKGRPLSLTGAAVRAIDIRAGAAMIIAALGASGRTEIAGVEVIERGYVDIVGKLSAVGADVFKLGE